MTVKKQKAAERVRRINGQLHFVHEVEDDQGNRVTTVTGPLKVECSGLLKPGSTWNFLASQIPTGAKSPEGAASS